MLPPTFEMEIICPLQIHFNFSFETVIQCAVLIWMGLWYTNSLFAFKKQTKKAIEVNVCRLVFTCLLNVSSFYLVCLCGCFEGFLSCDIPSAMLDEYTLHMHAPPCSSVLTVLNDTSKSPFDCCMFCIYLLYLYVLE